jgi:hypothetical protein
VHPKALQVDARVARDILDAFEQSNGSCFLDERVSVEMESLDRIKRGWEFTRFVSLEEVDDVMNKDTSNATLARLRGVCAGGRAALA